MSGADEEVLSESNYRDFAQRAVASYHDKGMIVDALLWRHIVAHYEAERTRLLGAMDGALHNGRCGCFACTVLRAAITRSSAEPSKPRSPGG
jgi:hypothetical protein